MKFIHIICEKPYLCLHENLKKSKHTQEPKLKVLFNKTDEL